MKPRHECASKYVLSLDCCISCCVCVLWLWCRMGCPLSKMLLTVVDVRATRLARKAAKAALESARAEKDRTLVGSGRGVDWSQSGHREEVFRRGMVAGQEA